MKMAGDEESERTLQEGDMRKNKMEIRVILGRQTSIEIGLESFVIGSPLEISLNNLGGFGIMYGGAIPGGVQRQLEKFSSVLGIEYDIIPGDDKIVVKNLFLADLPKGYSVNIKREECFRRR